MEAPPQALMDTCAHILWGVDDGPAGLEQSNAMFKVAVEREEHRAYHQPP
jgi:tyrosine-protein phosphatase YwqE